MSEKEAPGVPEGLDWKAFTPEDSPMGLPDVLQDPVARKLSSPDLAAGDPAFDFELPVCDFSEGVERATGETFRLRAVAEERPVALVFGSYT